MIISPELTRTAAKVPCFGPARVLGQHAEAGCMRVLLEGAAGETEVKAKVSASLAVEPGAGDLVLVAGERAGDLFVLSVLETGFRQAAPTRSLEAKDGARVILEEMPESSAIKVFSKRQELLFEYDSATEKVRLHITPGDLEIDVAGNIRFQSGKTVELSGQEIRLNAPEFGLRSTRARVNVKEMAYAGDRLDAVVKRTRLIMDRVERISKTVIERSQNFYRTVEKLTQLRTGRMRTLVDSTYHLKSRKAYLKSEKAFNIDGEKINLG